MQERQIGTVGTLFRYPVKSMLGEQLTEVVVGPNGLIGDRAWALREPVTGKIVSAKKWGNIFEFRADYETAPGSDAASAPRISLPDGRTVNADDPDASEAVSAALGHKVHLERAEAEQVSRALFDPAGVFGDTPPEQILPQIIKYLPGISGPDDFAMPKGTFFDGAPLHLVASGTLAHLERLRVGESQFDVRRFRPNILVDTGAKDDSFVEDEWVGGSLRVGEALQIAVTIPVPRCVMTTHAQAGLPRDLSILRAVAAHHSALTGVYARVLVPGRVRVGDPVTLVSRAA